MLEQILFFHVSPKNAFYSNKPIQKAFYPAALSEKGTGKMTFWIWGGILSTLPASYLKVMEFHMGLWQKQ